MEIAVARVSDLNAETNTDIRLEVSLATNIVIKTSHIFKVSEREVINVVCAPVGLQSLQVTYYVVRNSTVGTNYCD